jgi:hypothetical protein
MVTNLANGLELSGWCDALVEFHDEQSRCMTGGRVT